MVKVETETEKKFWGTELTEEEKEKLAEAMYKKKEKSAYSAIEHQWESVNTILAEVKLGKKELVNGRYNELKGIAIVIKSFTVEMYKGKVKSENWKIMENSAADIIVRVERPSTRKNIQKIGAELDIIRKAALSLQLELMGTKRLKG